MMAVHGRGGSGAAEGGPSGDDVDGARGRRRLLWCWRLSLPRAVAVCGDRGDSQTVARDHLTLRWREVRAEVTETSRWIVCELQLGTLAKVPFHERAVIICYLYIIVNLALRSLRSRGRRLKQRGRWWLDRGGD